MTDEEIEKALTQCGDLSEFDCKGCPLEGNALCFSVMRENALNYINRLKAKNKELQDKNRRVLDWKRRQEKFNTALILWILRERNFLRIFAKNTALRWTNEMRTIQRSL